MPYAHFVCHTHLKVEAVLTQKQEDKQWLFLSKAKQLLFLFVLPLLTAFHTIWFILIFVKDALQ